MKIYYTYDHPNLPTNTRILLDIDYNGLFKYNGHIQVSGDLTLKGNNNNSSGDTEIKLMGNGHIRAREVQVDLNLIPDYVFADDYELMPLTELREYVDKHHHLPGVKSQDEFEQVGSYALGEMNTKLLEKVEELTLYILQQQEQLDELKEKIKTLKY